MTIIYNKIHVLLLSIPKKRIYIYIYTHTHIRSSYFEHSVNHIDCLYLDIVLGHRFSHSPNHFVRVLLKNIKGKLQESEIASMICRYHSL